MKCPECGEHPAYIGATDVECPNITCRHYTEKQRDVALIDFLNETLSDPDKTPPNFLKLAKEDDWFTIDEGD